VPGSSLAGSPEFKRVCEMASLGGFLACQISDVKNQTDGRGAQAQSDHAPRSLSGNSKNVANQIVRRSRDATFWPVKASELRINFFFGPRMKMGGGPTRNEPRDLHSGVRSGATV
jgi:hypothetical protein